MFKLREPKLVLKIRFLDFSIAPVFIVFQGVKISFDALVGHAGIYNLTQKNGHIFAIVYSSKCVSVFLHQTLLFV